MRLQGPKIQQKALRKTAEVEDCARGYDSRFVATTLRGQ